MRLEIDPASDADLRQSVETAAHLRGVAVPILLRRLFGEVVVADAVSGAHLVELCRRMLDGYGETRRGLVRAIAEASPEEASKNELYATARRVSPRKNAGQVVGGLHGNLEQTWRSLGGPGDFITTTPSGFRMRAEIAEAVRVVLGP